MQRSESFDSNARLAKLRDAAIDMMCGNESAALSWLREPKEVFGGESPLAHAATECGARDVEDLIGRIHRGVFS
ncbi:MbcA/ParS/Xre antitoxin family protein [Zhongshania sp. BJYM1]|uniref:MbcA/ParS/Xre antitoxin family protein n=1 Tax=Zhongshania aquatica TaxID=2965069 RepID=UPI0022B39058|nr:MbcA/ParS/Xre antitoxin family protein [Marortus sp. BJYM1]